MALYDKHGAPVSPGDMILIGHNSYGIPEDSRAVFREEVGKGYIRVDVLLGHDAMKRVVNPAGLIIALM